MNTEEKLDLISNPITPSETLIELSKDPDVNIRMHADAACMRRQQELTKKARGADSDDERRELASDPLTLYEYLQQWYSDLDCATDVRAACKKNLEVRDWRCDEPVDLRNIDVVRMGTAHDFQAEKPTQKQLDSIVATAKSLGFENVEIKSEANGIYYFGAKLQAGKALNSAQNEQLREVIESMMPRKASCRIVIRKSPFRMDHTSSRPRTNNKYPPLSCEVYIYDFHAGRLWRDEEQVYRFQYAESYLSRPDAFSIATQFPLQKKPFEQHNSLFHTFSGHLDEGWLHHRQAIAKGVDPDDQLALCIAYGKALMGGSWLKEIDDE